MAAAEDRRLLRSWKEIATHFDVSVRTAQRWEKEAGLPIHRETGGRPFSFIDELEQWHQERSLGPEEAPSRPGLTLLMLLLLVPAVALPAAWWLWPDDGEPATLALGDQGKSVLAHDPNGRLLWSFDLPDYVRPERYDWVGPMDMYLAADIDGDGDNEALFNYRTAQGPTSPGILYCFETDGQLLWQRNLGREISFRDRDFDHNFSGQFVRFVNGPTRSYLLTVAIHRLWYPCQVALLDPLTGEVLEEYWHPGGISHLLMVDLDRDGIDEVVMAGINNPGDGLGHAAVFALKIPFSSVEPKNQTPFAAFTGGREYRYLLFPRPGLTFLNGTLLLIDSLGLDDPNRLLVRQRLTGDGRGYLFYFLDFEFCSVEFRISDDVISIHDRMHVQGLLDHAWSPQEKACLGRPVAFETAPDGNDPQLRSLWGECEFAPTRR